jgi:predicted DsbA family dithiol-disulfide isomerase
MDKLRVDIWSDIACPWCYVGKRRFEAALAQFAEREAVEVVWRSFELDTSARSAADAGDYAARLARKYRTSPAQAEGMIANLQVSPEGANGGRWRARAEGEVSP